MLLLFFQPCKFFPTVWSIWNSRVHLLKIGRGLDVDCFCFQMKVISFGESVKTPYLGIDLALVSPESADPECGEHHTINENHMNICKPKGKGSILYR